MNLKTVDWKRWRNLKARQRGGEKLSDEDFAFVKCVDQIMRVMDRYHPRYAVLKSVKQHGPGGFSNFK